MRHIFFLSSLRGQKLCLCEECQKREAAWEKLQIAAATRQVGGDMEKKGSPLTKALALPMSDLLLLPLVVNRTTKGSKNVASFLDVEEEIQLN